MSGHTEELYSYENVIDLPAPTADAVLNVLLARYFKDWIYTECGMILMAVNPYTELENLYSDKKLCLYCHAEDYNISKLPPHPWKTASLAVRAVFKDRPACDDDDKPFAMYDQSILISGESGAGKTETTKIIMKFLAEVGNTKIALSDSDDDNIHGNEGLDTLGMVPRKVLQTNPILDALGNARTLRNDNSSRFGKYIQLYFDTSGELRGSALSTFLLETPRVILQQPGERNFHIFYMICSESDPALRELYKIKPLHYYDYLILSGGCIDRRDGVRDDVLYTKFMESLAVLSADKTTIDGFLRSVMAVLTVGNTTFHTSTSASGEVIMHIDSDCQRCLEDVADLLGVPYSNLLRELTTRIVIVNHEEFKVTLPELQASQMRDVFAKSLYRAIFEWTISFLNDCLASDGDEDERAAMGKIGLLDIFGFESLALNSLEQLLINYANEHLQQHFDNRMIVAEQQLYINEGIEWSFVQFPSADDCIRLISGMNIATISKRSMSIISLLDEACIAPQGSDKTFIAQVYANFDSHPRIATTNLQKGKGEFGIKHYAGTVQYSSKDFVAKNKNLFFRMDALLLSSSHPFLRMLAETDGAVVTEKNMSPTKPKPAFSSSEGASHHQRVGVGRDSSNEQRVVICDDESAGERSSRRKSISSMKVATVSNTFCASVDDLIRTIDSTGVHYVKCFKPNDKQMKKNIKSDFVQEQLVCGGIVHNIKVTRSGFPVRFSYKDFYDRYYALMVSLIREVFDDSTATVRLVMDNGDESPKDAAQQGGTGMGEYGSNVLIVDVAQGIDIVVQRLQMAALTGDLVRPDDWTDEPDGPCIQRGKTIVFLRSSGYATLQFLHDKLLGARAAIIQSFLRMLPVRTRYLRVKRMVATIELLQRRRLELRKWRRKLQILRRYFRKCLYFARLHFKLVHLAIQVQRIYRNYSYKKRFWALVRFFRKVLASIRRKIAGRKLAKMLHATYHRYCILKAWQQLISVIRRFITKCGVFARGQIKARHDRAKEKICAVVETYAHRKRFRRTVRAICCLQYWVRHGGFRKYIDRQKYVRLLFAVVVVPLQQMWRWKKQIHKTLEQERERLRIKAMSSAPGGGTVTSTQVFAKNSLVQQYNLSHVDNVHTPNAKTLLRVNKTQLWNLFCHYAEKSVTIPTAADKKYSHGIVSRTGMTKLLLDWGVQPAVMSMSNINLIMDGVMDAVYQRREAVQQLRSSPSRCNYSLSINRLMSFNNFCRILLLIASDIVRSTDISDVAVRDPQRPVMSVRSADAEIGNPILSPAVGVSLRWVLTAMDRSPGRERLRRSRASTLVAAFAGVLGAAAADTLDTSKSPQNPSSHKSVVAKARDLKSGPMGSDVAEIFRRNESTLVSMALHYSATKADSTGMRKSYYSLLENMPAMSMSASSDNILSETEDDKNVVEKSKYLEQQPVDVQEAAVGINHRAQSTPAVIKRSQTTTIAAALTRSPVNISPSSKTPSPPKRAMTMMTNGSPIKEEKLESIVMYGLFIPGRVQPVQTFRAALNERDNKKRDAVTLTVDALWKLLIDFGVCPDHCRNKTDLRRICDLVWADSTSPSNGTLNYTQFIEVVNLIARNSRSNIAFGSAAARLRSVLNSMNISEGRNKILQIDRNALALPALKLCEEPADDILSANISTSGSGSTSKPYSRSTTPTPADRRRSATPPPSSMRRSLSGSGSSMTLRSRTPPPGALLGGRVPNLKALRSPAVVGERECHTGADGENGAAATIDSYVNAFASNSGPSHQSNGKWANSPEGVEKNNYSSLRSAYSEITSPTLRTTTRAASSTYTGQTLHNTARAVATDKGKAERDPTLRRGASSETRDRPRPSSAGRMSGGGGRISRGYSCCDVSANKASTSRPRSSSAGRTGQRRPWT